MKTRKCPSLSGKSKLTYNIRTDDDGAAHLRVQANTGGGLFSQEWISLEAIRKTLADVPGGVTAANLAPLFKGKSVNTPAFLLAVLTQEKLVAPIGGKSRRYAWQDTVTLQSDKAPRKRPPRTTR